MQNQTISLSPSLSLYCNTLIKKVLSLTDIETEKDSDSGRERDGGREGDSVREKRKTGERERKSVLQNAKICRECEKRREKIFSSGSERGKREEKKKGVGEVLIGGRENGGAGE